MAGEFSLQYDPGWTLYALALQPTSGLAWNGLAFVDPSGTAWESCAVVMVDGGAGTYDGVIPEELPTLGDFQVQAYLQLGVTPAASDPLVGLGTVYWPGSGDPLPGGVFRTGLTARLNGDVVLASLVGDRIFPQSLPQKTSLPAVVFRVPSIERTHDLDGPVGVADGMLELTAYALDFTECDRVAEELRNLFDGFTGFMGEVEVTETTSDGESDDYDESSDGSDEGTYEITLNYQITFRESAPNRDQ